MKALIPLAIGLILVLALLGGIDDDTAAQLAAERTERTALSEQGRTDRVTVQESEQTQRTAVQEANRTERTYITANQLMWLATERESTLRLVVVLLIVVVASTAAVIVAVQVLRQRAPAVAGLPAAPAALRRVAQRPGHRLEFDAAEGWIVVLPGDHEYYTEQDARRLLNG